MCIEVKMGRGACPSLGRVVGDWQGRCSAQGARKLEHVSGDDEPVGMQRALVPAEMTTGQLHSQAWTCIQAGEKSLGQKPCLGSRQIQPRAVALERASSWARQAGDPKGLDAPEAKQDLEGSVFWKLQAWSTAWAVHSGQARLAQAPFHSSSLKSFFLLGRGQLRGRLEASTRLQQAEGQMRR